MNKMIMFFNYLLKLPQDFMSGWGVKSHKIFNYIVQDKVDFYVKEGSKSRWNRTFIWPSVFIILLSLTGNI